MGRNRTLTVEQKRRASERNKAWRHQNKDRIKALERDKYIRNKDAIRERSKQRYELLKKEINAQQKLTRRNKRPAIAHIRAWRRFNRSLELKKKRALFSIEYERRRAAVDISYRMSRRLRTRLRNALRRQSAAKSKSTFALLGCDGDELKAHLAAQFQPGMSWSNYGKWHIDHIRPCASFDLSRTDHQELCFHYSNLQPLWAKDNIRKSSRLTN